MSGGQIVLTDASKRAIARIYKGNRIIGAGFLVAGGYVMTCAHVVRDAMGLKAPAVPDAGSEIKLNFPYVSLKEKLRAELLFCRYVAELDAPNEDVAGLRLLDPLPEAIQPVQLHREYVTGGNFRAIGFPKGQSKGIATTGQFVESLPNGWVQLIDPKAQGYEILGGFSGTAIWGESEGVLGMAVARAEDRDQPNARTAFMVPGATLIKARLELERAGLLRLLQPYVEQIQTLIPQLYKLAGGRQKPCPTDLSEVIASLQDTMPGEHKYRPLDQFVALLTASEQIADGEIRDLMVQWLQANVSDSQAVMEHVQSLLPSPSATVSATEESHLLIYIEESTGQRRSVKALFIADKAQYDSESGNGCERIYAPALEPFEESITLEILPDLVRACLEEVTQSHRVQDLTIHLILPMAWLHQDCDRWPLTHASPFSFLEDIGIGTEYRLVVRVAERLYPNAVPPQLRHRQKWESRWQALGDLKPHEVCSAFACTDGLSTPKQYFSLLSQPQYLGLKSSKAWSEDDYVAFLQVVIATGTPVALWLRQDQFTETVVAADDIDQLLGCKFATLPETVRQCRLKALEADENAHIGHHLSLLWEDPKLVPPGTQPRRPHPRNPMSLGMPKAS